MHGIQIDLIKFHITRYLQFEIVAMLCVPSDHLSGSPPPGVGDGVQVDVVDDGVGRPDPFRGRRPVLDVAESH